MTPGILHPSTLIAPHPHLITFAATVFSEHGLRTSHQNSAAGLSEVPKPCHCLAAAVEGIVMRSLLESVPAPLIPLCVGVRPLFANGDGPKSGRSAPAALSSALLTQCDFGKPVPKRCVTTSLISNPASSSAVPVLAHEGDTGRWVCYECIYAILMEGLKSDDTVVID